MIQDKFKDVYDEIVAELTRGENERADLRATNEELLAELEESRPKPDLPRAVDALRRHQPDGERCACGFTYIGTVDLAMVEHQAEMVFDALRGV